MNTRLYDPVAEARKYLFVREATGLQNTGARVEAIQRWCGGKPGESWCAYFVTMILDVCYQGDAPVPRQGSCEAIRALGSANGWLTDSPAVGCLALSVHDTGDAHHIAIVTSLDPLMAIAGNTSEDGTSSNGDRVAEHVLTLDHKIFMRIPE